MPTQILDLSRPHDCRLLASPLAFLALYGLPSVVAPATANAQLVERGHSYAIHAFGCIVEHRARADFEWVYAQHDA
ncbi:MAG: hypothetical protein ACI9R3_001228 [Verrucomicrobiales bacterium]